MLDADDAEMWILIKGRADGAISGRGSDVEALGARVVGIFTRPAAKDNAIVVHKVSHGFVGCVL